MKKISSLLVILVVFSFSIVLTSCGGSGATSQNYQDPSYQNYTIKKVAVLPIRNTYMNIGEAQNVNRFFITELTRKVKGYEVVGPEDAIAKLNQDSLVEKYYEYLVKYSTTGIPNRELIKQIGTSLNVDGIVQGEIYNITKVDGRYGGNKGETKCSMRYSLLSANDGKVLWETTAEGYKTTTTTLEDAPPLMDVIMECMTKIIESVPSK
ncbi:MAG: hypothetical protein J0M18_05025 [Ignavibacteria bacterium]|nr:hypothetical protein [Ignavibacteria bacterium]